MTRLIEPPSPSDQLDFLRKLQRIIAEGSFTATYKFALLQALADLSVERGDENGSPLVLSTDSIAEKFIEYYWEQTKGFPAADRQFVTLQQNKGQMARILALILEARARFQILGEIKASEPVWKSLRRQVRQTVEKQPLTYLQNVGGGVDPFLYAPLREGHEIVLRAGIASCFRIFHPFIIELARTGWLREIRRMNSQYLSEAVDLYEFCFGSERRPLGVFLDLLREIQSERCFYCNKTIKNSGEVDHFVPRIMYPVDLAHNFVLADRECNNSKRDVLAEKAFHKKWLWRNSEFSGTMSQYFFDKAILSNRDASEHIAKWAYKRAEDLEVTLWRPGKWMPGIEPYSQTCPESGAAKAADRETDPSATDS